MTWTMRRAGWDTETTGTDVATDRIVTAAIVVRGGGLPDQTFSWVIDPGVDIPVDASDIHGWTTERVRAQGADPRVALDEFASKLAAALSWGMPLVAFNAAYDWSILDNDLRRHGLTVMDGRLNSLPLTLVDPYVIDKAVDKYRSGRRKLKPVCELYGITLEDWHTAEADALAALLLAEAIADRYPRVGAMGPAELFKAQQAWAAEQAADLQRYFRSAKSGEKQDPNAVIDGSWPLRGRS
jgi:DNA polymerase-3 subunit epsilon